MTFSQKKLFHEVCKSLFESASAEKKNFKDKFLQTYSDYKTMSPRGEGEKEVRFGLKDATKKTSDQEAQSLITDLGYEIVQIISPGTEGSKSSKYKTYLVRRPDQEPFSVVYGSANKGEKFEAELHADLSGMMPAPLGDVFLSSIGISREDVLEVEPFKAARKRPLTGEIKNVGEEISDITMKVQTPDGPKRLFISLKDPTGGTFANQGYSSAFVQNQDGTISQGAHDLDDFVDALGIDKEKVARGVSDYSLDRQSEDDICQVQPGDFDADKIASYLASALGYGYIYARQSKGGFHIIQLDTPEDAKKLAGIPTSVAIRYARSCGTGRNERSKGTTATIQTDNGAKYSVAIRNASGKIKPSEMKISLLRYPDPEIDVEDLSEARAFVRKVLVEELTASDKRTIERLAKKQAKALFDKEIAIAVEKEIKKRNGPFEKQANKIITDRFKNAKSDKDFDEAVIKVSKRVLKALHDMHYKRTNLVDQMPVPKS